MAGRAARLMPTTKRLWDNAAPPNPAGFGICLAPSTGRCLKMGPTGTKVTRRDGEFPEWLYECEKFCTQGEGVSEYFP